MSEHEACFPEGEQRDRLIRARSELILDDYCDRITGLIKHTGCCETCAKCVSSTALAHVLIKVFISDYEPNADLQDRFINGVLELCNSLIEPHLDDEDDGPSHTFTPSDN